VIADSTTDFFERLAAEAHQPLLNSVSGTLRFDLADGLSTDHWYVRVEKGDVEVSHDELPADAIMRLERQVFDAMAEGRLNAVAAFLRGELALDGDVGLVISFQRLFPGPPPPRGAQ
jgi:putative sterol carrier protein